MKTHTYEPDECCLAVNRVLAREGVAPGEWFDYKDGPWVMEDSKGRMWAIEGNHLSLSDENGSECDFTFNSTAEEAAQAVLLAFQILSSAQKT